MICYFILTDSCCYHCSFCIRENISATFHGNMEYSSFEKVAESLHYAYPEATINFTGGEPTMHPKFKQFVNYAVKLFNKVCITSNGSFNKDIADFIKMKMKDNLYLQISLDGTEEIHDKIRGNNAFKKAIENIKYIEPESDHISISTTVGKNNLNNIRNLAAFLNKYKFHHWKVSQEQVSNPSKDNIIPTQDWNSFVDSIIPLCNYRIHIKKLFAFKIWDKALANYKHNECDVIQNCGYGKGKMYITPKFDVLACTCMKDIIGNLAVENASTIKSMLDGISNIEPDKSSKCYSCKYRKICNGGCPGYSLKCFGKINMGDIRCPLII